MSNYIIPYEVVFDKILPYLDGHIAITSTLSKAGRDHVIEGTTLAFKAASQAAVDDLKNSLIKRLAGRDVAARVAVSGPERLLASLHDHFFTARLGEESTDPKILEHNLRLEFGNKEALRILCDEKAPKQVVDDFCKRYDRALISLYKHVPGPIQVDPDVKTRALQIRIHLEANQSDLARVSEIHFSPLDQVSVIPYELGHFTHLKYLWLQDQLDTLLPKNLSQMPSLVQISPGPLSTSDAHRLIPFKLLIGTTKITSEIAARFPEDLRAGIYPGMPPHLLRQTTLKALSSLLSRYKISERLSHEDFDSLCFHVWDLAGRPEDPRGDWGERHLLEDFNRFETALVHRLFEKLSPQDQEAFDLLVWINAGKPAGDPLEYGKLHRYDDPLSFPKTMQHVTLYRSDKARYDKLDPFWKKKFDAMHRGTHFLEINSLQFLMDMGKVTRWQFWHRLSGEYFTEIEPYLSEAMKASHRAFFSEGPLTKSHFHKFVQKVPKGFGAFMGELSSSFMFHKLAEWGHRLTEEEVRLLKAQSVQIIHKDPHALFAPFLPNTIYARLFQEISPDDLTRMILSTPDFSSSGA